MFLTGLLLLAIAPPSFLYNQDPLSWGGTTHSSLGPPKPTGNKTIPHKPVTDLSDLGNPSTETPPQVLSSTKVRIKANQDKVFISLISFLLNFYFWGYGDWDYFSDFLLLLYKKATAVCMLTLYSTLLSVFWWVIRFAKCRTMLSAYRIIWLLSFLFVCLF